jgi:RNA-directed DNA polymerase
VTSNSGKNTPDVDGKVWKGNQAKVRAVVKEFLRERGLELSKEKTKITPISNGFTVLGQTFRKRGKTLRITPSNERVLILILIRNVGTLIRRYTSAPLALLIKKLNEMLRGWANYHRHVVASKAFSGVDRFVYDQLWRMLHKRHRKKSRKWLYKKVWIASGRKWVFAVLHKSYGRSKIYEVIRVSSIGIKRYRKIKADANPYLPEYTLYFWQRRHWKDATLHPKSSASQMRLAL